MRFSTQEEVLVEEEVAVDNESKLVLYNDDVNTFDFVIDSLISVCGHDSMQAEQCTLIVHYKGKCAVKQGEETELITMCSALLDRGLTAELQ